jgi:hypothetical protein
VKEQIMGWVAGDNDGFPIGGLKTKKYTYSFAVNGGAQGDIALTANNGTIPAGAFVVEAFAEVTTPPTSGGAATIAVKIVGAADVNAADAISGAPWSAAGLKRLDKLGAADAGLKLASAASPVITVATADLTAGVINFYVRYFVPTEAPIS